MAEIVNLYILNKNFEHIYLLNDFESLIWVERYNAYGDFEIYTYPTNNMIRYAVKNNYIWKSDSDRLMIIEEMELISDVETGVKFIIRGRSLESILDRRIIWTQTRVRGNIQSCIKKLINESIIAPDIENRKITNFIFKNSSDLHITTTRIDMQFTGDNLLDAIMLICQDNGIGFKLTLDDNKNFVFQLYNGTDRSYDQDDKPHIVFSPSYANLLKSNYFESIMQFRNTALVAGEDEGEDRKTRTIGNNKKGINRRELYVDARDLTSRVEDEDGKNLIKLNFAKTSQNGVTISKGQDGKVVIDGQATSKNFSMTVSIATIESIDRGKYLLGGTPNSSNNPYEISLSVASIGTVKNGNTEQYVINNTKENLLVSMTLRINYTKTLIFKDGDTYEREKDDTVTIEAIGVSNVPNPRYNPFDPASTEPEFITPHIRAGEYSATIKSNNTVIEIPDLITDQVYTANVIIKNNKISIISYGIVFNANNIKIVRQIENKDEDDPPKFNNASFTPQFAKYAIHDIDYNEKLDKRGTEKLSEVDFLEYFEGEIDDNQQFAYKKHYSMGDLVQISNEFGMEGKARIIEFITSYDTDGIKNYPTFKILQTEEEE